MENNGKVTDEQLLALTRVEIKDPKKYSDEDRVRWDKLHEEKYHEAKYMEERLKRYTEHPEKFLELDDIICAAVHNPNSPLGLSVFTGSCPRSILGLAEAELNHVLHKTRLNMDIESAMKHAAKNKLIVPGQQPPPSHKIMKFVRNGFKRK